MISEKFYDFQKVTWASEMYAIFKNGFQKGMLFLESYVISRKLCDFQKGMIFRESCDFQGVNSGF